VKAAVSVRSPVATERAALVALAITVALWGSAFAVIRIALDGFAPTELAAFRLLTASVALGLIAVVRRPDRPARSDLPRLVVLGLTGMAAYQLLLNLGEVTVSAGVANVLASTSLLFTALVAVALLGERISGLGWLGLGIAVAGTVLVSFAATGDDLRLEGRAAVVLAAAAMLATFFVVEKPLLGRLGSFTVTAYATWIGTLALLPLTASLPDAVADAGPQARVAALYLGVGPAALGYVTWAYAVARVDVAFASSTLYVAPVFAFLPAWVLHDEVPTMLAVVGGLVTVGGVALTTASRRESGFDTRTDASLGRARAEQGAS
jgi:drug/metabolite transporter (DMT)-like permease